MGKFSLKPGEKVGNRKYRVISHFTDGSFGSLYVIENVKTLGKNILKVNLPHEELIEWKNELTSKVYEISKEEESKRTIREARITAKLNHSNIIKVNDLIHVKDKYKGIIYEMIENSCTLQDLIENEKNKWQQQEKKLPYDIKASFIDFALQIVDAVKYIRSKGFLHRDLKLDNIIVDSDSSVKIIDFGLACHIDEDVKIFSNPRIYTPPEFYEGEKHINSDLWPTALICLELLTGTFLFGEKDNEKVSEFVKKISTVFELNRMFFATFPDPHAPFFTMKPSDYMNGPYAYFPTQKLMQRLFPSFNLGIKKPDIDIRGSLLYVKQELSLFKGIGEETYEEEYCKKLPNLVQELVPFLHPDPDCRMKLNP